MTASGGSGGGLQATTQGVIWFNTVVFGTCGAQHIFAFQGAIVATGNYTINGGSTAHVVAQGSGTANISGVTITITGTPAFSTAFAQAAIVGLVEAIGNTFMYSATGLRYQAATNGVIYTNGQPTTYLPGGTAGTTATGGQYG